MRMRRRPACSASMRISVAPASSAFSSSSFTTEAGRSTTSPAAILFATLSERMRIRPIAQVGDFFERSGAHGSQELGIVASLAQLVEEKLHGFHRRKRHEQLFLARAALVNVNGREYALVY